MGRSYGPSCSAQFGLEHRVINLSPGLRKALGKRAADFVEANKLAVVDEGLIETARAATVERFDREKADRDRLSYMADLKVKTDKIAELERELRDAQLSLASPDMRARIFEMRGLCTRCGK